MTVADINLIFSWLMVGNAVITIVAYVPQILQLVRVQTRAESISISSWLMWTYAATVGLIYSIVVLKDPVLIFTNVVSVAGIITILGLTLYNRYFRFAHKAEAADNVIPLKSVA